ncbi:unnamed protein product, partial [Prorocentrum cordatum]
ESGEKLPLLVMLASSVAGGLLFAGLNRLLNEHGAAVRKSSTTRSRFQSLRSIMARRLANRLLQVPMFAELDVREVVELIRTAMFKEHYHEGDVIISREARNSGLFFVISGVVRLQLSEGSSPTKPKRQGTSLLSWGLAECPSPRILDVLKRSRSASPCQGSPDVGERPPTWDLGPDKVFGDMALLHGMRCGMVAVALRNTKVLRIPGHQVMRLVDRSAKVRSHVSRRAVENLGQIDGLEGIPEAIAQDLADRSPLVTFQPGQLVFQGLVDEQSPIISVIFGAIEVRRATSETRQVVKVNDLLCTEHLLGEAPQPLVARALEPTSVLLVDPRSLALLLPKARARSDDIEVLDVEAGLGTGPFAMVPVVPADLAASTAKAPPVGVSSATRRSATARVSPRPGEVDVTPDMLSVRALPGEVNIMPDVPRGDGDGTALSPEVVAAQARMQDGAATAPRILTPPLALEVLQPSRRERLHTVGRDLGWDSEGEAAVGTARSNRSPLTSSRRLVDEIAALVAHGDVWEHEAESGGLVREPLDVKPEGQPGAERPAAAEHDSGSAHAAIMVWLGILIDAVPESLVIGILINKSAEDGDRGFRQSAATALPFVIGVFISNLPESMSSSGSMLAHGVKRPKILLMWAATTVVTAVGAGLGALLFPPGSSGELHVETAIAGVEGLAAGAMLTMIAQTMMPEAFEQGGDIVGLSTLAGFLCALSVKLLPLA